MNNPSEKNDSVYDYVIIGAGASGPIIANSLATAGFTVLLLEAGLEINAKDQDVWDPQRWFKVQADTTIEWGHQSTPQKNLRNRKLSMQQSKGLGGCTIHNAMVYVRGGQTTYDHWANCLGCTGWDYKSLEPLFKDLEERIGILRGETDPLVQSFFDASKNQGLPYNENYNQDGTEYGYVPFQFAIEKKADGLRRTTSYEKYIGPQPDMNGLTVEQGAFVHRILFKETDNLEITAQGVLYQNSDGDFKTVYVNHEVILSAGTIASPKILLQSGIGPKAELEALGITVIIDLPAVGKNFYDDLGIPTVFTQKQALPAQPYGFLTSGVFASDQPGFDPAHPKYAQVNLEMQVCSSDLPGAPQIEIPLPQAGIAAMQGKSTLAAGDLSNAPIKIPYYSVGMAAMHLKSRGSITLASSDPCVKPVVDPNYLSDPADMEHCKYALKLALKISWDNALDDWRGLPLLPMVWPSTTKPGEWEWLGLEQSFDQYLEDYISTFAISIQHYIGSCSMGNDPLTSVVDSELKVHGILGLRVIDASVAPTPVTGNTAGVSYVIGAKGAQLLARSKKETK
jgi:choline dehydrogenase